MNGTAQNDLSLTLERFVELGARAGLALQDGTGTPQAPGTFSATPRCPATR